MIKVRSMTRTRLAAGALGAVSVVGAVESIRLDRPGRFVGLPFPGNPLVHALTIGTPLSPPPVMLALLAVAVRERWTVVIRILSVVFLAGIVGEADTPGTVLHPSAHPVNTCCVVLLVVLPVAMFWAAAS